MYNDSVHYLFRLGTLSAMDTVDMDRMSAGCEYLGNVCIPNLLSAYTWRKQFR